MATTEYGDITPRESGKASRQYLKRAMPNMPTEKFGQAVTLEAHSTKTVIFRRPNHLAPATTPLTEGVAPTGKKLDYTDVSVTLSQYGDYVSLSDVVNDCHTDPAFKHTNGVCADQGAKTVELIRLGVLKGGTSVFYANGTERDDVNTGISLGLQRRVIRALKAQDADAITEVVSSSPNFNTEPVEASFVCLCHSDCQADVEDLTGYIPARKYGENTKRYEGEIGSVGEVRYIVSTLVEAWANAGGTKGTMLSTGGTLADVYPLIYLAKDAYGIVALKGEFAVKIMVVHPKASNSQPLGQSGSVGWKTMQGAVILNDLFMCRVEVAVRADPS